MKKMHIVKQYVNPTDFERGLNEGPGNLTDWAVEKYFEAFGAFTVVFVGTSNS